MSFQAMLLTMRNKLKIWLKRYLPAEIIGTIFAIIIPTLISFISENVLVIALVGTWSENVGFYGTMIIQEIIQTRREYKRINKNYNWLSFVKNLRNIILEFGIAETFDSLLVRPATMYFGIYIFQNIQLGVFTGKILADLIFYVPTIVSYELRKKHLRD